MSRTRRTPDVYPFDVIEREFELIGYTWFDGTYKSAVFEEDGGYLIRVLRSRRINGASVTDSYDYFRIDADGTVRQSPRGYARTYNGNKIDGLPEALTRYAAPRPGDARLVMG